MGFSENVPFGDITIRYCGWEGLECTCGWALDTSDGVGVTKQGPTPDQFSTGRKWAWGSEENCFYTDDLQEVP